MVTLAMGLGELALALFVFRSCSVGGLTGADAGVNAVAVADGRSGADVDDVEGSPGCLMLGLSLVAIV